MIQQLSYRENFGRTIKIAYPVMLSQLGHILVGVIDSIMVGQLGPEPLAAGLIGPFVRSRRARARTTTIWAKETFALRDLFTKKGFVQEL